ncbi:MAG: FAD-dependent oxidoreductase [Methylophaga sp.]|nr:MAG: FAD-dependent oxidoreductase [Methylophaga sp.]
MTILIVGGGWSGLAAAITCVQQGQAVHLIESAKQLGGRARNVPWGDDTIDNGQHLMIGAYERMLAVMQSIGIDTTAVFQRQAMDLTIHDTEYSPLRLSSKAYLPWPLSLAWNLASSAGISAVRQVAKLQSDIKRVLTEEDISVSDWLLLTKQPQRLVRQLWEPLCLATLNTPIAEASAHLLAIVLRDSLGKGKSAADTLIPSQPLGDLFPQMAAKYIQQQGGKISLGTRAKALLVEDEKVTGLVTDDGSQLASDAIIVATTASQSDALLSPHMKVHLPIEYPICTVYLQYAAGIRLKAPMLGMSGTISQWIFDRSEQTPGLMAVVISAPGRHEKMTKKELISCVCKEVHQLFPVMPKQAEQGFVIREKRATFACTVDIEKQRPSHQTDIAGLWLAGDYVANNYPATLEGAIRNGENCAKRMVADLK